MAPTEHESEAHSMEDGAAALRARAEENEAAWVAIDWRGDWGEVELAGLVGKRVDLGASVGRGEITEYSGKGKFTVRIEKGPWLNAKGSMVRNGLKLKNRDGVSLVDQEYVDALVRRLAEESESSESSEASEQGSEQGSGRGLGESEEEHSRIEDYSSHEDYDADEAGEGAGVGSGLAASVGSDSPASEQSSAAAGSADGRYGDIVAGYSADAPAGQSSSKPSMSSMHSLATMVRRSHAVVEEIVLGSSSSEYTDSDDDEGSYSGSASDHEYYSDDAPSYYSDYTEDMEPAETMAQLEEALRSGKLPAIAKAIAACEKTGVLDPDALGVAKAFYAKRKAQVAVWAAKRKQAAADAFASVEAEQREQSEHSERLQVRGCCSGLPPPPVQRAWPFALGG